MATEKNMAMVKSSRNIKGGIVGLANVGKTSVFNMYGTKQIIATLIYFDDN
jgi:GTPase SAR1 family protein